MRSRDSVVAKAFSLGDSTGAWLGTAQRDLLDFLAAPAAGGMKVILGRTGTGKSCLATAYAARCPDVFLSTSGAYQDIFGFQAALLASAGLSAVGTSEIDRRNLLAVFIEHQRTENRRVQIFIDDAHLLNSVVWPELGRLQAVSFKKRPAAELVFCGQPSFRAMLQQPTLTGLQSLHARVHVVGPMPPAEVGSYLNGRLSTAGLPENLFTSGAVQFLAQVAKGRVPVINTLSRLALVGFDEAHSTRVDIRRIQAALAASRPSGETVPDSAPPAPVSPPERPETGELLVSRNGVVAHHCPLAARVLIGRGDHNDLALEDPYISRHHAAVIQSESVFYVVDLNSAHGLSVNAEVCRVALLEDQDVIGIGPYRLKFVAPKNYARDATVSLADTGIMPAALAGAPGLRQVK